MAASLQTASPEYLEILGVIPGGRKREMELHNQLHAYRVHGEWFEGDHVIRVIADLLGVYEPTRKQLMNARLRDDARERLRAFRAS